MGPQKGQDAGGGGIIEDHRAVGVALEQPHHVVEVAYLVHAGGHALRQRHALGDVARHGQAQAVRLLANGPHDFGLHGAVNLDLYEASGFVALH